MRKTAAILFLAITLTSCGSVRVTNRRDYEIKYLSVLKAEQRDDGRYTCSDGVNILKAPIHPGASHMVWGLSPGRYCVTRSGYGSSAQQVDVPLIGIVNVYFD